MAKEKTIKKERPKESHVKHKPSQHELQEKYMELQMLKQQIASFVEQKQAVDEKVGEIHSTIEALNSLPKAKKGDEIWSPLGNGTFVRSDIKDIEKVLVAIGAGVVVKETLPKAMEILEGRARELSEISDEIVRQANLMVDRINKLEPELEQLVRQSE